MLEFSPDYVRLWVLRGWRKDVWHAAASDRAVSARFGDGRRMIRFALLLAGLLSWGNMAEAATVILTRGVNITNWFRYPPSRDPSVLAKYLSDRALAGLHAAGFDFVRLAVDPDVVAGDGLGAVLVAAIRRIQAHGLAVIVSPHPHNWHLEDAGADRDRLVAFWHDLAPKLAVLDQDRTLPEVLNEPVFSHDPGAWARLQHQVLGKIRHALPHATVVLTGSDWGSIGGLLMLTPEADRNVVYSFHFYDPAELTALAAYRTDVDHAAMGRLPFPADDRAGCDAVADVSSAPATRDLARYYCSLRWDEARIGAGIDRAVGWGRRYGVRLLAGEFGASVALNAPARDAWLRTVREAFEVRHVPWALWGYDDSMGFAVKPSPRGQAVLNPPVLNPAVLAALGMAVRR
jgi:endoglucanase